MKFKSLGPHIVHMIIEDPKELASAMIRFQEHYESPFDDIRGKIFTIGQIKAKGSTYAPNVNTYCGGLNFDCDWDGYNVPGHVFDPFIKGLFDPLTDHEKDILEVIKRRTDRFYFIATHGKDDPGECLDHELRHALYYTNSQYKKEIDEILTKYSDYLVNFKKWLKYKGYTEEVFEDECQAYMGPDYDWFFAEMTEMVKKYNIVVPKGLSMALNTVAEKYLKELK